MVHMGGQNHVLVRERRSRKAGDDVGAFEALMTARESDLDLPRKQE